MVDTISINHNGHMYKTLSWLVYCSNGLLNSWTHLTTIDSFSDKTKEKNHKDTPCEIDIGVYNLQRNQWPVPLIASSSVGG